MIFGVKKCHMYLYVKCFILVRDHVHVHMFPFTCWGSQTRKSACCSNRSDFADGAEFLFNTSQICTTQETTTR